MPEPRGTVDIEAVEREYAAVLEFQEACAEVRARYWEQVYAMCNVPQHLIGEISTNYHG